MGGQANILPVQGRLTFCYIISLDITESKVVQRYENIESLFEMLKKQRKIIEYYISSQTELPSYYALGAWYAYDVQFFDPAYLSKAKFGRAVTLWRDRVRIMTRGGVELDALISGYITLFRFGRLRNIVFIFEVNIPESGDIEKNTIIDLEFPEYIDIVGRENYALSNYILEKINDVLSIFGCEAKRFDDIRNNIFVFVALDEVYVDMRGCADDIEKCARQKYRDIFFDILMISEAAYKSKNYDVHTLYNEQEIERALVDIAIGVFVQMFVRERRALLITLTDGERGPEVPFGDILRSYIITLSDLFMEYTILRKLNEVASELIVERRKASMKKMLRLRDDLTRILEDIMAVSLQRMIARDTSFRNMVKFMGVSKLKSVIELKLDKLENMIRTEYELKSNILLIILNAFTLISIIVALYEFIEPFVSPLQYIMISIAIGVLWLIISIKYLQQYIM